MIVFAVVFIVGVAMRDNKDDHGRRHHGGKKSTNRRPQSSSACQWWTIIMFKMAITITINVDVD
jgi:hypothetical protein